MTKQINQDKLKAIQKLYTEDEVAKAAFDYFATFQRDRSITTVNRLLSVLWGRGCECQYWQVRDFLRELSDLDCGRYVIGRRGQQSRLEWSDSVGSLGRVAAGEVTEIAALSEAEATAEEDPSETLNGRVSEMDMKLTYPLRRDRSIEFVVPRDITPTEAQRFGDFIKTLQFE